jgi:replication-associated recombination protein RarA
MSILLSLMETGIVTELKAFRTDTIQLKTWVFGAANDISKMPKELLSRFVVFQLPNYSRQEFIDVVVKVLTEKEKVTAKIARYIAEALSERTRDVRHAVKIARVCKKEREVDEAIKLLERYKGI